MVHVFFRSFRIAHQKVFTNSAAKQSIPLGYISKITARGRRNKASLFLQRLRLRIRTRLQLRMRAKHNAPLFRQCKSKQHTHQGCFPSAGFPHYSRTATRRKLTGKMAEYRCLAFHIAKRNIIDFHIGSFSKAHTFLTAFFRQPLQLFQSVYSHKYLCKGRYQPGKVQHRTLYFPHQLKKSGHCTESYSPRTETDTTPQKSGKIPPGKSQRYKRTCGKRKSCTSQNLIA